MLRYFFAGFFLNLTFCVTKLRVLALCFSYFADNSTILRLCLEIQKNLGPKIMLQIWCVCSMCMMKTAIEIVNFKGKETLLEKFLPSTKIRLDGIHQRWAVIKHRNRPMMVIRLVLKVHNHASQHLKNQFLIYNHAWFSSKHQRTSF